MMLRTENSEMGVELRPKMVRPERLELPAYWFEAMHAQGINNIS